METQLSAQWILLGVLRLLDEHGLGVPLLLVDIRRSGVGTDASVTAGRDALEVVAFAVASSSVPGLQQTLGRELLRTAW